MCFPLIHSKLKLIRHLKIDFRRVFLLVFVSFQWLLLNCIYGTSLFSMERLKVEFVPVTSSSLIKKMMIKKKTAKTKKENQSNKQWLQCEQQRTPVTNNLWERIFVWLQVFDFSSSKWSNFTYFGASLPFFAFDKLHISPRYRWTQRVHRIFLYSYLTCHTLIVKVKSLCFVLYCFYFVICFFLSLCVSFRFYFLWAINWCGGECCERASYGMQ